MHRFTITAVVTGFMLGLLFLLSIDSITSYQAEHCANVHTSSEAEPKEKEPSQPQSEDKEREAEISDYAKSHPRVCGVIGFPRMVIGYMDHHEGFFVSFFTALLFVVTGLLAIFTFQLVTDARDVSAKQLKATDAALISAEKSADASNRQARASVAANRAHVRIINFRADISSGTLGYIVDKEISGTIKVDCHWGVKNYGASPADI